MGVGELKTKIINSLNSPALRLLQSKAGARLLDEIRLEDMLRAGIPATCVSKITGLPVDKIRAMAQKMEWREAVYTRLDCEKYMRHVAEYLDQGFTILSANETRTERVLLESLPGCPRSFMLSAVSIRWNRRGGSKRVLCDRNLLKKIVVYDECRLPLVARSLWRSRLFCKVSSRTLLHYARRAGLPVSLARALAAVMEERE